MQTIYHNSNGLTGEALKKAVANATRQEDAILLIYKNTRQKYSASSIHELLIKAGHKLPLTSTRRGITNLLNRNELVKLSEMTDGVYGKQEHKYQLNFLKYPSKTSEQPKMF